MSNDRRRRPRARVAGVTLIELIVTLVIVGAALAGMVAVFASTTRASVDPVVVQQMQAIADNMMEEILLKPSALDVEACGAAHHLARKLEKLGHTVKLIAPQLVKPYVARNKNDGRDAEGLCEAASRHRRRTT